MTYKCVVATANVTQSENLCAIFKVSNVCSLNSAPSASSAVCIVCSLHGMPFIVTGLEVAMTLWSYQVCGLNVILGYQGSICGQDFQLAYIMQIWVCKMQKLYHVYHALTTHCPHISLTYNLIKNIPLL